VKNVLRAPRRSKYQALAATAIVAGAVAATVPAVAALGQPGGARNGAQVR
jgi:hypothetical protein